MPPTCTTNSMIGRPPPAAGSCTSSARWGTRAWLRQLRRWRQRRRQQERIGRRWSRRSYGRTRGRAKISPPAFGWSSPRASAPPNVWPSRSSPSWLHTAAAATAAAAAAAAAAARVLPSLAREFVLMREPLHRRCQRAGGAPRGARLGGGSRRAGRGRGGDRVRQALVTRKTLHLPCISTAFAAETVPLPCVSIAFAAKKVPLPCASTAFVPKAVPLPCVSTVVAAKAVPLPRGYQVEGRSRHPRFSQHQPVAIQPTPTLLICCMARSSCSD